MSIVTCQTCGKDFPGPTLVNVTITGFGGDNSRAIAATCPHCRQTTGILPPGDGSFSTSPVTGRIERVANFIARANVSSLRDLNESLTTARADNDVESAASILRNAGLLSDAETSSPMSLREQRIWQLVMVILGVLAVVVPMRTANTAPTQREIHEICRAVETRSEEGDTPSKKVGRNQKCPCGNGAKFKNCHGAHPTARDRTR